MDLKQFKNALDTLTNSLKGCDKELLESRLRGLISAYPFNEYEFTLMFLLEKDVLSFDQYETLRKEYVSSNRYMELYGLAPRIFGGIWAEQHVQDLDNRFQKPGKHLDSSYEGQYDLWIEGVRVEVKSSRATRTNLRGSQQSRVLHYLSTAPIWMNFQQLKPDDCDVFVFVGVWLEKIVYWVLSSSEVQANTHLSHQHRGGIEYQIGFRRSNIEEFNTFLVDSSDLGSVVIQKGRI